jgi:hypothetical protein
MRKRLPFARSLSATYTLVPVALTAIERTAPVAPEKISVAVKTPGGPSSIMNAFGPALVHPT